MSEGWLWCLYCAAGGFWDLRPFLSWTSILISKNWAPINFSTFILRYRIITSNKKRHLTFEIIYRKKSFRIRDFFSSMRNWWKNPCLRSNPFFLVSETKNPRQMIVKSPGLDHLNVFSYIFFRNELLKHNRSRQKKRKTNHNDRKEAGKNIYFLKSACP